ncbi:hypothetical protein ACFXJ8_41025 [Nonomuraea sp. NPDC059194]|uniref:hypothetical protein n=1 Tax=Nonomuraea sp. NPDC059194 TaxID=3346764 RepID=UPI0036AAB802
MVDLVAVSHLRHTTLSTPKGLRGDKVESLRFERLLMGRRRPPDVNSLLALADRAAEAGGAVIVDHLDRAKTLGWKSSPADPVTDTDRSSEAQIMTLLGAE